MALNNNSCYNTGAYSSYFSSILIIMICLVMISTTNGILTPEELKRICDRTESQQLCLEALGGIRENVTLESAAELGFQTAQNVSVDIINIFHRTLGGSLFKELAGKCEQKYNYIYMDLIIPGHEALRVGRWNDFYKPVLKAITIADECESLWDGNSPAHDESRKLKVACQAIYEVSKNH